MRQQLDLDVAQRMTDELTRITDEDPTLEGSRWMRDRIQEVIDEVNHTRRERDNARDVVLKAGKLVETWNAIADSYDDYTGTTNLGYGFAATELGEILELELTRD